jgi:hypothetical protein
MKKLTPVFLLLLLSILGCKIPGSLSSGGGNNSSAKDSNTANPDPKPQLTDAFKKFRNAAFVTVKKESVGAEAKTVVEQYSAATESFSRKYLTGDGIDVIIVGKENFSKQNSFWPWLKDTGSNYSASETFFPRYDLLTRHIPDLVVDPQGEETIEGKAASVYKLRAPKPNPDFPTSIRVWIEKDKGLILKIVTGNDKEDISTEVFDFDTPVKIERPKVEKNK